MPAVHKSLNDVQKAVEDASQQLVDIRDSVDHLLKGDDDGGTGHEPAKPTIVFSPSSPANQ